MKMNFVKTGIGLIENGWVPDSITRAVIRRLCRSRLEEQSQSLTHAFMESMRSGPIAILPEAANEQHYEVPADFYRRVLGPRLKYSSCYFENENTTLAEAENASLELTCQHAELADGQRILELGCGWGSLSLWMAERFPTSEITSVSNSNSQREHIESVCRERSITNLQVVTADMNDFSPATRDRFDRVVSVEMFEHMRNYESLLNRIASWLNDDGKLFVHIFCHRQFAYPFETKKDTSWMAQYFFSGGLMPSENIFDHFSNDLIVEKQHRWNGSHYQRTLEAWLQNQDADRERLLEMLATIYGETEARRWFQRWRMFFMASAELFGYAGGEEWFVSHYRLRKR